jgi:hypothetical protein
MQENEIKLNQDAIIGGKDIYKIALDTRNFEISLFWQRSNYFLVLNTAIGVGYFNAEPYASFFLAIFGSIVSFLWFRVNLGSKFWQSRWEQRLSIVEKEIAPSLNFFAAEKTTIYQDVEDNLDVFNHKGKLRNLLDKMTLTKPSVSLSMTLLSLLFMCIWLVFPAIIFLQKFLNQ